MILRATLRLASGHIERLIEAFCEARSQVYFICEGNAGPRDKMQAITTEKRIATRLLDAIYAGGEGRA